MALKEGLPRRKPRVSTRSIGRASTVGLGAALALDDSGLFATLAPLRGKPRRIVGPGQGSADYRLEEEIARGGMGEVWRAHQAGFERKVALKRMLRGEGSRSEHERCRFLAEAVLTGRLEHQGIVPVYDLGFDQEGLPFYAMKLVAGKVWFEELPFLTEFENLGIFRHVCDAVAFAHAHGVLHRDLKPDNVMIGPFGEVLLMDWGLAVELEHFRRLPRGAAPVAGTPAYMAPEQAEGDPAGISIASDIYLLGAMLHEILTGEPPHPGSSPGEILAAARENLLDPGPPPGELGDIARRALATDPAERFASVAELGRAVEAYLAHVESRVLARHAQEALRQAERSGSYDDHRLALLRFEEALRRWEGNAEAAAGRRQARSAYAERALAQGDLELAESLAGEDPALAGLKERARAEGRERRVRERQFRLLRRLALGAMVVALASLALGVVLLVAQRRELIRATRERDAAERRLALDEAERGDRPGPTWRAVQLESFAQDLPSGLRTLGGGWIVLDGTLVATSPASAFALLLPGSGPVRLQFDLVSQDPLGIEVGPPGGPALLRLRLAQRAELHQEGVPAAVSGPLPRRIAGLDVHARFELHPDRVRLLLDGREVLTASRPGGADPPVLEARFSGDGGTALDNLLVERLLGP